MGYGASRRLYLQGVCGRIGGYAVMWSCIEHPDGCKLTGANTAGSVLPSLRRRGYAFGSLLRDSTLVDSQVVSRIGS